MRLCDAFPFQLDSPALSPAVFEMAVHRHEKAHPGCPVAARYPEYLKLGADLKAIRRTVEAERAEADAVTARRSDYASFVAALAPLSELDHRVFDGASREEQSLAAFVLALALIYNDFKGLAMVGVLAGSRVAELGGIRVPEVAELGGMQAHAQRAMASLIHELLELLSDRATTAIRSSAVFGRVLRACSPQARSAWNSLLSACRPSKTAPRGALATALSFVRNKVTFHYDPKLIKRGFDLAFQREREFGKPVFMTGRNLQETRFCFADAAAQAYFFERAGKPSEENLFAWDSPIVTAVHLGLFGIVNTFVALRREEIHDAASESRR